METNMLNASFITSHFKRVILFLSIALLTSLVSFSQDSTAAVVEPAYVNLLRVHDGNLYFVVKFQNPKGRGFDVIVKDGWGERLYHGNFNSKEFGKIFRAPAELGKLYVTIHAKGEKTEHKFEISSEARLVREAYVTAMSNRQ